MTSASTKEFPPFRLDPTDQCLWRRENAWDDERISLTPKAFAVLSYLVEHAGHLITQEEFLEEVWPDTFVQPEVLKYQIARHPGRAGGPRQEFALYRDRAATRVPVHRRRP